MCTDCDADPNDRILGRIDEGPDRTRLMGYRNPGGPLDVADMPSPTAAPGPRSCTQPPNFLRSPPTLFSIMRRSPQLKDMAIPVLQ